MTTDTHARPQDAWQTPLAYALAVNFVWINASEVFRYFAFVMPMMREAFSTVPDVAPMNLAVFMVWAVWDTILVAAATLIPWMALKVFGGSVRNAVLAGTGVWFTVFVIFWLAAFNMNLATPAILLTALPLAWLEMVVAALVVWWFGWRVDTLP